MADVELERGLPCNIDAERFCLGTILRDNSALTAIAAITEPSDFSLMVNRHIFEAMLALHKVGTPIDRLTVADYLINEGKLERSGGMTQIAELDESLPDIVNPSAYAQIVKEQALLRQLAFVGSRLKIEAINTGANASDLLAGLETTIASISRELTAPDPTQRVSEIVDEIGVNNLLNPSKDTAGMPTGFFDLDDRTTGLQRQTLTIVAARPSAGKSSLMTNIAMHMASKENIPVAIFSMEMSKRNLIERMVCAKSKINLLKLRSGILRQEEREELLRAASFVHKLPIFIDDSSALTYQQVSGKLDRLRRRHGVKVAFLDYIQQMSFEVRKGGRDRNDNERLTETAEAFKSMAKRQDVAIVALSQLSRAPEMRGKDHRPMLSDLRSSGGLEQAADLVVFIFREYMYHPDKDHLKEEAELIIGKQRQGPTGSVAVRWRSSYASFENK